MKRIALDAEPPAIRHFIDTLPIESEGVELELNGHVLCRVVPVNASLEVDKESLVRERWSLILAAQERTRGIKASAINREIQQAIDEVRSRTRG